MQGDDPFEKSSFRGTFGGQFWSSYPRFRLFGWDLGLLGLRISGYIPAFPGQMLGVSGVERPVPKLGAPFLPRHQGFVAGRDVIRSRWRSAARSAAEGAP